MTALAQTDGFYNMVSAITVAFIVNGSALLMVMKRQRNKKNQTNKKIEAIVDNTDTPVQDLLALVGALQAQMDAMQERHDKAMASANRRHEAEIRQLERRIKRVEDESWKKDMIIESKNQAILALEQRMGL